MGESRLNVGYMPPALPALRDLKERLCMDYIYMPLSYDYEEIRKSIQALSERLDIPEINAALLEADAERALEAAKRLLRDTPVVLDYTATPRPLGLAELLLDHGFNVRTVYADAFIAEERPAFDRLREKFPELELRATVHPKMGLLPRAAANRDEKVLAIGQKAAYFEDTTYFVNMLECGGYWGFDGILRVAEEICDAFVEEKDTKKIIQVKGWGCCC